MNWPLPVKPDARWFIVTVGRLAIVTDDKCASPQTLNSAWERVDWFGRGAEVRFRAWTFHARDHND